MRIGDWSSDVCSSDLDGSVTEGEVGGGRGAAEHVLVGEEDLTEALGRLLDGGVVEGDLVVHPLVVGVDPGGAQDQVLHPVGGGPAGGTLALEPDAPGVAAASDDLVAEGDQDRKSTRLNSSH